MNIGIFSHCSIDTITFTDCNKSDGTCDTRSDKEEDEHSRNKNNTFEQIGGAACYCGLTARQFNMDVSLATKFGSDFPANEYLVKNKIKFSEDSLSSSNSTTRFNIRINNMQRDLFLKNLCDGIDYTNLDADGIIITPIFNEVSTSLFGMIKKDSDFILLDPQGFLRRQNVKSNQIYLEKTSLDLKGISAIKASTEEMDMIVGGHDTHHMKELQKDVEYVLLTNKEEISLLAKDKMYFLRLPNKEIHDTTGIGDIFCSTFCCTILKEKDFLWAFCFAAGAAQASLDTKDVGLNKIPKRGKIEINASYFYNTVKFRHV